jgi:hypothetical protein
LLHDVSTFPHVAFALNPATARQRTDRAQRQRATSAVLPRDGREKAVKLPLRPQESAADIDRAQVVVLQKGRRCRKAGIARGDIRAGNAQPRDNEMRRNARPAMRANAVRAKCCGEVTRRSYRAPREVASAPTRPQKRWQV